MNPTNPTNPNNPNPTPQRPEPPQQQPPDQSNLPNRDRRGTTESPGQADGRQGATESQTGDRRGPAVGYNQEPQREEDEGGVS